MNKHTYVSNFIKGSLIVFISVFIISGVVGVVYAGTITPPVGAPSAQFFTLSDIFTRLATNATATEGGHLFTFADSLAGTGKTLTEIYNAIPTIDATKILSGTTYLGVAGTIADNGAFSLTAGATDQSVTAGYYSGGTLAGDADLLTDNILNGKTIFGVSGKTEVVDTSSGDAVVGDILSGKIAWVDGLSITGAMPDNGAFGLSCGASDQAVTTGFYSGGTLVGDADLTAGNIQSGTTIFGVTGTALSSPTFGDNDPTKVLNTASNPGTYDTATCATTYNTLNLSPGTVKSGTSFGVGLTGDYPSATFSLPGDTGATDALETDLKTGLEAWTKAGVLITGSGTQILSSANDTVNAGYYEATTLSAVDTDLAAANILSGTTIFGVAGSATTGFAFGDNDATKVLSTATGAGTALLNLWNGSNTAGTFPGGSQANGGVDDYNAAGAPQANRYAGGWTACNAGNSFCGTSDAGADAKDNSTGLVWSLPCAGAGCATFSDTSPLTYSWDASAVNNSALTASQLCSNHTGWSLPHQKQLMQAYIDGSYGNLEASGVNRNYWSATTQSDNTTLAWRVVLSNGTTNTNTKTNSNLLRCVWPGN